MPPRFLLLGGLALALAVASLALYEYVRLSRLLEVRLRPGTAREGQIFSRPLRLRAGQTRTGSLLRGELLGAGFRQRPGALVFEQRRNGAPLREVALSAAPGGLEVSGLREGGRPVGHLLLQGRLLASFPGGPRQRRTPLTFRELPTLLVQAVLAAEDEHFFEHSGFDWRALLRAAGSDLLSWSRSQGGSTLTQQFVKNRFLGPQKTFRRKLEELALALILEHRLSKEEIFQLYSNQIYLGRVGSFSIFGFAAGARTYFGKTVGELDLAQSALLAGLIRAPNRYSPFRHPERARARRDQVLDLMYQKGMIDARRNRSARLKPLEVLSLGAARAAEAPYFVDLVERRLPDLLAREEVSGPVEVWTTLDPGLQRIAARAVRQGLDEVEQRLERHRVRRAPQAALLAVDPRRGDVLALVGGRDYSKSQFNRAVDSLRQPGSAFKPFVYAAALASGFTLASRLEDAPYTLVFDRRRYTPHNYDRRYRGPVSLRQALAESLNVPTVRLASRVGFRQVVSVGERLGLEGRLEAYPAVALGTFEVSLWELAQAYTAFAHQGRAVRLRAILGYRIGARRRQVRPLEVGSLDPAVAFLVTSALESTLDEGTGRGVRARGFGLPAAGKTGTTRDGWFVGYTPDLLCAVWVGLDESGSLDLTGARSALPIWTRFMKGAERAGYLSGADFPVPAGIIQVEIDPQSGLLASPRCPARRLEYFLRGTEPRRLCHSGAGRLARDGSRRRKRGLFGWLGRIFH